MEWIFVIAAVFVAIAALLGLYVARARERKDIRIPGHFDFSRFDHYKADENAKRGLFDKTKWR